MASGILAWILLVDMAMVPNASGMSAWIILVGMASIPNGIRDFGLDNIGGHGFGAEFGMALMPIILVGMALVSNGIGDFGLYRSS